MKNRSYFLAGLFALFLFTSCDLQEYNVYKKVTPSLREKINSSADVSSIDNYHDVVVVLDETTTEPPSNIDPNDIKYVAKELVHAVFARVNDKNIRELASNNSVVSIDEDYKVRTNLFYATKQIGAREVWGQGYKGKYFSGTSSKIRLAVIDTGVDLDHNDFTELSGTRIADAVNCYNQVCSASGQKDDNGHGTHVAGVVLGNGDSCDEFNSNAYFEVTGSLGSQVGAVAHYFTTQFNAAYSTDVSAQLTWDGAALSSAGVFFRTKANANEDVYITPPGPQAGAISEAGPGVTSNKSYTPPLDYPISSAATDKIVPYAFSAYTDNSTLKGKQFWAYIKTVVQGWGDLQPRMAGMSRESELVAVKALGANGDGNISDIIRGMEYINSVAESENIIAVNMSFSLGDGIVSTIIDTAAYNLVQKGVTVVVSAGNDQESNAGVSSPGTEPSVITVGAVNELDQVTEYSSVGSPYQTLIKPDVLAPGGSRVTKAYIASTKTLTGSQWNHMADHSLNDPYTLKVGTSQATPFVTGLVGLMASKRNGSWTFNSNELPKLFKMLICMSAYEVGAGESGTITPGYSRTAASPGLPERAGGLKDRVEGYGKICAQGALSAFDSSGMSFTFGEGLGEQKSFITKVTLSASKEYNYIMNVPSGTDFDLYLFDGAPDSNGEPVLLASSAIKNNSVERIVDFIPPKDGDYYLVAKWISGSNNSSIALESERAKPATPTTISNVSVYRDVINKIIVAKWKTNVPAADVIEYGEDGGMGSRDYSSDYKTDHEFHISIDYNKNYYLRMLSSSQGASEADISTAVTRVYKISTQTGRGSFVYDISPQDLPSLNAGGCGTVKDVSQRFSALLFLLPIMFLIFIRIRLISLVNGGRKLDTRI